MEGFFRSCLKAAKEQYNRLAGNPKAGIGAFDRDVKELIEKAHTAIEAGELSEETGRELIKNLSTLNVQNIKKAREANKKLRQERGK